MFQSKKLVWAIGTLAIGALIVVGLVSKNAPQVKAVSTYSMVFLTSTDFTDCGTPDTAVFAASSSSAILDSTTDWPSDYSWDDIQGSTKRKGVIKDNAQNLHVGVVYINSDPSPGKADTISLLDSTQYCQDNGNTVYILNDDCVNNYSDFDGMACLSEVVK